MATTLRAGPNAHACIKRFEGCGKRRSDGKLMAYPDPATGGKPWTIGWGSTTDSGGKPIQPGTVWTQQQADFRLSEYVADLARRVAALIGDAPTTQNQFDALVSFAYNVGVDDDRDGKAEGLGDSTLLRLHKKGDYAGAAAQFALWNKASGKVMDGLTRRRRAEAALYSGRPE